MLDLNSSTLTIDLEDYFLVVSMRYQATILVVISLSVVVGVIIDKPIVFPDDMGPLPLGGWRADDRMHKVCALPPPLAPRSAARARATPLVR